MLLLKVAFLNTPQRQGIRKVTGGKMLSANGHELGIFGTADVFDVWATGMEVTSGRWINGTSHFSGSRLEAGPYLGIGYGNAF